jgi:site-specific DNA-methyltransferase (cytosine-N4-specific)
MTQAVADPVFNESARKLDSQIKGLEAAFKPTGSFVLDLGGSYQSGRPVRSLYNFRFMLRLCDEYGFRLAEEFFWHNPAKLPSPIE